MGRLGGEKGITNGCDGGEEEEVADHGDGSIDCGRGEMRSRKACIDRCNFATTRDLDVFDLLRGDDRDGDGQ